MDFPTFLFRSGRITREEFSKFFQAFCRAQICRIAGLSDELAAKNPSVCHYSSNVEFLSNNIVYQSILSELPEILQRNPSRSSVDALLQDWYEWHLQALEPVSDFSLSSEIGRRVFANQYEKKLIANYVARNLVRDGDTVVLLSGTSDFYAGMAIASNRQNIRLMTNNGVLIRECMDNERLAQRFREVVCVSGLLDVESKRFVTGQVGAEDLSDELRKRPESTVLIGSAAWISPEQGLLAESPRNAFAMSQVMHCAFDWHIRDVMILADFSKLIPTNLPKFGDPVFSKDFWADLSKRRGGPALGIITTPPPELRDYLQSHPSQLSNRLQSISSSLGRVSQDYEATFQALRQSTPCWNLHEALELSDEPLDLPEGSSAYGGAIASAVVGAAIVSSTGKQVKPAMNEQLTDDELREIIARIEGMERMDPPVEWVDSAKITQRLSEGTAP